MFDYALKLRDGTWFRFRQATVTGDWVHLSEVTETNAPEGWGIGEYGVGARGVDVRAADIVWVMDAPEGS